MATHSDPELNHRIIELSRAISSLFDTASSTNDIVSFREDTLRTVTEQSEIARRRLSPRSRRNNRLR